MNQKIALPIEIPYEQIHDYCQSKPILRLGLFGSIIHNDFEADSDIDVLVEYTQDVRINLLDMASQEIELTAIMGRKVDLRTAKELSPYFRAEVLAEAFWIYERN
jgi:uncharacterized protein